MFKATFDIVGITPISFSKMLHEEKRDNETHDKMDQRVWRLKGHYAQGRKPHDDDELFIPAVMLRKALASTAKYLGIKVPGKGANLYTKHFERGIVVQNLISSEGRPVGIGTTRKEVTEIALPCNSQGKKGGKGGSTVIRRFPIVHEWSTSFVVDVIDDVITEEVFEHVLRRCGMINGLGRWRPQNGGDNGRFTIENLAIELPVAVGAK